jgi:hypothetical protein
MKQFQIDFVSWRGRKIVVQQDEWREKRGGAESAEVRREKINASRFSAFSAPLR